MGWRDGLDASEVAAFIARDAYHSHGLGGGRAFRLRGDHAGVPLRPRGERHNFDLCGVLKAGC